MLKTICQLIILTCFLVIASVSAAAAQSNSKIEVLTGDSSKRKVPTSFYFAGLSGETQMPKTAAKISENRLVIAGVVDTSGSSIEINGKYGDFFITDSPVKISNKMLETGAYSFGFSIAGKFNFFRF